MKNALILAFAIIAPSVYAGPVIRQNGGVASTISPSVVNASTVTITGTGTKCFSVDDPTFVVDCNLNFVGVGAVAPASKLHMSSGIFTLDGTGVQILLPGNGSAAANTVRIGAENNGLYSANAGQLSLGANGTEAIRIFNDQDVGIGYISGTAIAAKLAVNGSVGIGTDSPATKLHLSSGVITVDGTGGGLRIGEGSTVFKITKTATASTDLGGAVTANCTAETNFSITGVAVGDSCTVTTPAAIASTDWVVCRTLVDNVALKYCTQGVSIDPAAMVYHITTIEY